MATEKTPIDLGIWKCEAMEFGEGENRGLVAFWMRMSNPRISAFHAECASAAPEMYAALKSAELAEASLINEWADFWDVAPQSLIDKLMAAQAFRNSAIAKAEGEPCPK